MKTIRCWNDLCPFGIIPLTGEACGLSYRILCDLTVKGKQTIEKALSVTELGAKESWNRGDSDDPHVGSIMLSHDLLPFLSVFALLENGCREVWLTKDGGVIGIEADDTPECAERFQRVHADSLVRRLRYGGTAGDRNRHVMSGCVV